MRFEIKPPYVIVHDDKPGERVTLNVGGESCPMNGDASSFSDAEKRYAWAFDAKVKDGDFVTFATADRVISGVVRNGAVVIGQEPREPAPPESVTAPVPKLEEEKPQGAFSKAFSAIKGKKPSKR